MVFWGPNGFQWGGMIRCSKNSSKFKVFILVWNLNDRIVLVILNLAQLISCEIDMYAPRIMFYSLSQIGDFLQNVTTTSAVHIVDMALTVWDEVEGFTGQWAFGESCCAKWHDLIGCSWWFLIGCLVAKHGLTRGLARGRHVATRGPPKFGSRSKQQHQGLNPQPPSNKPSQLPTRHQRSS